MDFGEIITPLVFGRRIRRKEWPEGLFLESDGSNVWMRCDIDGELKTFKHYCAEDRVFTLTDICSDDWMFYY